MRRRALDVVRIGWICWERFDQELSRNLEESKFASVREGTRGAS
ncbi:hypothetical protein [Metallosphaera hakonensis]|nr:hypothetical protein [Metallosphaera hakonensis]